MLKNIRTIALLIFILPILTTNLLLIISQSLVFKTNTNRLDSPYYNKIPGNYFYNIKIYEPGNALRSRQNLSKDGYAIPYIDGSTTISRLGRVFPNNYIFKPILIMTGLLICLFWAHQKKIFDGLNSAKVTSRRMLIYGVLFGTFLIIHIFFLGFKTDNNLINLILKLILFLGVIFSIICKLYYVKQILKLKKKITFFKKKMFSLHLLTVYLMSLILICSVIFPFFENIDRILTIVEWNYFLILFLFYLSYFFSWKNYSVIQPPPKTL